jgi:hypothetical protein
MPAALPQHLLLAEFSRNAYRLTPEVGLPLAEILKPSYWVHTAVMLRPGNIVEVAPTDMSWFAELYVRSAGANEVRVALLRHVEFDKPQTAVDTDECEIKFAGGAKWRVMRKADKAVLSENHQTREQAEAWLARHTQEALA